MLHAKQLADRKASLSSSLSASVSVKSTPKRESGFSVETAPRGSDIEKDEVALLVGHAGHVSMRDSSASLSHLIMSFITLSL
jgi:hypothetical protein